MGVWILPYSEVKLSLLQLIGEEEENVYRLRKEYSSPPLSRVLAYLGIAPIQTSSL